MTNTNKNAKIKILKNGPYIVTGNIPLSEKIIIQKDGMNEYKEGRELPQAEEYALCRCGKSRNAPFCDGAHVQAGFIGTETASKDKYEDRVELLKGPEIDLLDDNRCSYARFCHRKDGKVWELTRNSDKLGYRKEAIKAATGCPSGRFVVMDKEGKVIEPDLEPSIEIIQDPEQEASGGIFVKGNIPIESSDGQLYEVRNRVALCRCGRSRNKPFCDATHVSIKFSDE